MRSTLYSLAALPLAAQALKSLIDNRIVQQPGVLRYPITVSHGAPAKGIRKRQDAADLKSQKTGFFYSIDIAIGTPAQTVSVNFDTGSSELWVNPVCSKSTDPEFCETFGRYSESLTYVDTKAPGGIKYGTGYVDFEYGYDFVQIGSAKIKQQIFGVATDSEFASVGILGAGPDLTGWNSPYPYVIDNLAKQGLINSRAFSLDIRTMGSDRGSVIFGGIDTKKFSSHLEKRPIIPAAESPDGYTRYWIYLDGITVTKEDGSILPVFHKPNGQPVLLDSGYTISTLPGPIFDEILKAFPSAKQQDGSDEYLVDCGIAKTKGAVNFKFGETVIHVPYDDFTWKQPENGVCKLGVARDDNFPVLGDTFLRAAYVVYDWDNRNIHLANNEDCGSHLLPIGSGPDAVPSVLGDCGVPVTTTTPLATSTEPPVTNSKSANYTWPATTSRGSRNATWTNLPTTTSSPRHSNMTLAPTAASSRWHTNTTAAPTLTSTFTTTRLYTITSCPPTVTNCPVGHVTTEILTSYTTYCPGEGKTSAPQPTTTTTSSSQYPEITATYTLPRTYTCSKGKTTCAPQTSAYVITVTPIITQTVPVTVPHCTTCAPVIPSSSDMASTPALVIPTASASNPAATVPAMSPPSSPVYAPPASPPAVTYQVPTSAPTPAPTGGLSTVISACSTCGPVSTQPTGPPVTGGVAGLRAPAIVAAVAGILAVAML